jgi:hypothetical protein
LSVPLTPAREVAEHLPAIQRVERLREKEEEVFVAVSADRRRKERT